jgi:uncharacterized PurR-regulated membrane protein YhhQ (DUF165 family)
MRRHDEFTTVEAWRSTSRIVISGLLILSAFQFLAGAVIYRVLGSSETEKLLFAGFLIFAALAAALCIAFWKTGAPTWKDKLAVAIVVVPAALRIMVS